MGEDEDGVEKCVEDGVQKGLEDGVESQEELTDELLKERVRECAEELKESLKSEEPEVLHTSGLAQHIARSAWFEQLTVLVIALNALWIGFESDKNDADNLNEADAGFQVGEHFFCTFFTIEVVIRFLAFKNKRDCLQDKWFMFDSTLVAVMVLETWILLAMTQLELGNTSIFRLIRLVKLSRMTRLMRALPELMILIKGLRLAVRSVTLTFMVLLFLIYIVAIMLRMLTSDTSVGDRYYSSVPRAFYTLLIYSVIPDMIPMMDALSDEKWYLGAVFFVFLLLVALTMMNMLIGLLCDNVKSVSAQEQEALDLNFVETIMRQILFSLDSNHDGMITKVEFLNILHNQEVFTALQRIGVDVLGLLDHADFIFESEDIDGVEEARRLSFEQFMSVVVSLRGANIATVRDIMDLRKFLHVRLSGVEDMMMSLPYQASLVPSEEAQISDVKYRMDDLEYLIKQVQSAQDRTLQAILQSVE